MASQSDDRIKQVTSELSADRLWDLQLGEEDVRYRPVPHPDSHGHVSTWRVRFDLTYDPRRRLGLEINDDVILGRGEDAEGLVSLSLFDADQLGVSRRHVCLRPTNAKLYVIDMESTNGTRLNGRSIGVNSPYSLSNGDILTLGQLEFVVRIIKRPSAHTTTQVAEVDSIDLLVPASRAITSQLAIDDVLKQTLAATVALVGVDEASIWLVDEQTGELFLEAEQGIDDELIRHMRLSVSDTLAGRVIATGMPVRANRQAGEGQIKVKTGYLVEAVLYVPLTLGGVTFGVLSAAHRTTGRRLSSRDEKLIAAVADFAAVAVQNSRLHQATQSALTRRMKVLTALSYALSYDLKSLANSVIGYAGLLADDATLNEEALDSVDQITRAGNRIAYLIEQLLEITALSEEPTMHSTPCDLVELVSQAVSDMHSTARARSTDLDFQLIGEPYVIRGDSSHLYRSVINLIDNAIKYSPPGAQVNVALVFVKKDIIIRVRDTGPGIPEDDLPLLFDRYFRGKPSTGVGLGLEIVRATVEAHRGTVMARNAEDGGAEFIVTLPCTLRVS